jgi:hypothetical protein
LCVRPPPRSSISSGSPRGRLSTTSTSGRLTEASFQRALRAGTSASSRDGFGGPWHGEQPHGGTLDGVDVGRFTEVGIDDMARKNLVP